MERGRRPGGGGACGASARRHPPGWGITARRRGPPPGPPYITSPRSSALSCAPAGCTRGRWRCRAAPPWGLLATRSWGRSVATAGAGGMMGGEGGGGGGDGVVFGAGPVPASSGDAPPPTPAARRAACLAGLSHLDGGEDGAYVVAGAPAVLDDVQAQRAVAVHLWQRTAGPAGRLGASSNQPVGAGWWRSLSCRRRRRRLPGDAAAAGRRCMRRAGKRSAGERSSGGRTLGWKTSEVKRTRGGLSG